MASDSKKSKLRTILESPFTTLVLVTLFVTTIGIVSGYLLYRYLLLGSSSGVIAVKDLNLTCEVIIPYMQLVFIFGFLTSVIWALHLYALLRYQDTDEHDRINKALAHLKKPLLERVNSHKGDEKEYPYSFHQLAYTHKQWAQLWFTITIAIFLGGLIYAVFNVGSHICSSSAREITWAFAAKAIIPNLFAYTLFFIAWTWSARHFRAHWHNFIVNSYRHRALWRYEEIERKLVELASGVGAPDIPGVQQTVKAVQDKVADTLLEMVRLSGVLLLLPGDSSYLDAGKDEKLAEQLVKFEEVVRSTASRGTHT
jgi:hypothetical protein